MSLGEHDMVESSQVGEGNPRLAELIGHWDIWISLQFRESAVLAGVATSQSIGHRKMSAAYW